MIASTSAGDVVVVHPGADEAGLRVGVRVARRERRELVEDLGLGEPVGQLERAVEAQLGGDVCEQLLDRRRRRSPRASPRDRRRLRTCSDSRRMRLASRAEPTSRPRPVGPGIRRLDLCQTRGRCRPRPAERPFVPVESSQRLRPRDSDHLHRHRVPARRPPGLCPNCCRSGPWSRHQATRGWCRSTPGWPAGVPNRAARAEVDPIRLHGSAPGWKAPIARLTRDPLAPGFRRPRFGDPSSPRSPVPPGPRRLGCRPDPGLRNRPGSQPPQTWLPAPRQRR